MEIFGDFVRNGSKNFVHIGNLYETKGYLLSAGRAVTVDLDLCGFQITVLNSLDFYF